MTSPPEDVAAATCLTPEQVLRVHGHIEAERHATRYLRCRPLLVEQVSEVVSSQAQE